MRKRETQIAYDSYLESKPDVVSDWVSKPSPIGSKHWKLIKNEFPYDALDISRHDLVIPKRAFGKLSDATADELSDLVQFLDTLDSQYSYSRQNNTTTRTVPFYFHIHMIRESSTSVEKDLITDTENFASQILHKYTQRLKSLFPHVVVDNHTD